MESVIGIPPECPRCGADVMHDYREHAPFVEYECKSFFTNNGWFPHPDCRRAES